MIADLVRRMAAAGAPAEAIAIAVEAIEAAAGADDARRRAAREKKRRQRADAASGADDSRPSTALSPDLSPDCPGTELICPGTVPGQSRDTLPPSRPSPQTPQPTHPPTREDTTRTRGSRLDEGFEVPADWRKWARDKRGWSGSDVDDEAEGFVDFWHSKPGADGRKLDWEATWRNWVRNARRQPAPRGSPRAGGGEWVSPC